MRRTQTAIANKAKTHTSANLHIDSSFSMKGSTLVPKVQENY